MKFRTLLPVIPSGTVTDVPSIQLSIVFWVPFDIDDAIWSSILIHSQRTLGAVVIRWCTCYFVLQ